MRLTALLTFFFFNDTATTEIYTLSLHDALPIYTTSVLRLNNSHTTGDLTLNGGIVEINGTLQATNLTLNNGVLLTDRKSTRLNSSHLVISYAAFCLKKKSCSTTSRYVDYYTGGD